MRGKGPNTVYEPIPNMSGGSTVVRNSPPEPGIVVEEHDIDIPPDTTATGVLRIIEKWDAEGP